MKTLKLLTITLLMASCTLAVAMEKNKSAFYNRYKALKPDHMNIVRRKVFLDLLEDNALDKELRAQYKTSESTDHNLNSRAQPRTTIRSLLFRAIDIPPYNFSFNYLSEIVYRFSFTYGHKVCRRLSQSYFDRIKDEVIDPKIRDAHFLLMLKDMKSNHCDIAETRIFGLSKAAQDQYVTKKPNWNTNSIEELFSKVATCKANPKKGSVKCRLFFDKDKNDTFDPFTGRPY